MPCISDHLPCFCTSAFSNFNKELYTEVLNTIDFMSLISSDVNESMNNIIKTMQDLTDKHVPLKKTSNSKKKQLRKPWISNCILISIKKRQKLFKLHFLSGDPGKIQYYKTYNNRLNKVKAKEKKTYFDLQFSVNQGYIKMTWKLIGMLVNRDKKNNGTISRLLYNNKL